jgi:hypothetical protein
MLLGGLLLVGCGDGDSGNAVASRGGPPPGSAPDVDGPPPLPVPNYTGNTKPARVNDSDAALLGLEMLISAQASAALTGGGPDFTDGPRAIAQNNPGPGGFAKASGYINADGTGWAAIDYNGYRVADPISGESFTYDGRIQIRHESATGSSHDIYKFGLSHLKITGPQGSDTFTGTITVAEIVRNHNGLTRYTTDFVSFDSVAQASIKAEYEIRDEPSGTSISGRMFDSRIGYVNVSTTKPLSYNDFPGAAGPYGGGPVTISGAGAASISVNTLNDSMGSIGIDKDGDGRADEAVRVDWQSMSVDTRATPAGAPAADAWLSTLPAVAGQEMTLEGRYSHAPDGRFLHFDWSVALAPAGSRATLRHALTATPAFTPDVAGDYLLGLEVSNAQGSGRDTLKVHVYQKAADYDDPLAGTVNAGMVYQAGADFPAAVDQTVRLHARTNQSGFATRSFYFWSLQTPPNSQSTLDDAHSADPKFTVDVPGVYQASVGRQPRDFGSSTVITAGVPLHYDPATALLSHDLKPAAIAVGDLNDDSRTDIAYLGIDQSGASELDVLYNRSSGRFSAPLRLPLDGASLAIGDLNGDGKADVAAAANNGVVFALQQDDGSLGTLRHAAFSRACDAGFFDSQIAIARLFGEARNSVVVTDPCDAGLRILEPVPDGAIAIAKFVPFDGTDSIAIGDFNGDGVADIAGTGGSGLTVIHGRTDGTFGSTESYTCSAYGPSTQVSAGDFDSDGRLDIAYFCDTGTSQVLYQQPDGSLGGARPLSTSSSVMALAAADVDGDGRLDLALVDNVYQNNQYRPMAAFLLQQANGTFSKEVAYPSRPRPGRGPNWPAVFALADINNDNVEDILFARNSGLYVMLGDPLTASGSSMTLRTADLTMRPSLHSRTVVGATVHPPKALAPEFRGRSPK